jgi:hypothetical protein
MRPINWILIAAIAILSTSCATSGVQSTGPQTYSLSATRCGLCAPVSSYVTEQATNYCKGQSKQLVVINIIGNNLQPMFPGSATINFRCATPIDATAAQLAWDECKRDYETADLDPIRTKIEVVRAVTDAPPPFSIASNEDFPSDSERAVIEKWATIRDDCLAKQRAARQTSPAATALQLTVAARDSAFSDEIAGKVSALIVALYQRKMTYGEFAQKRYEIGRDGADAEREYRQAMLMSDQQLAMQAQQLAQQNFQAKVAVWSAYIQAVNARPPQTVVHVEQNVAVH